jgi:hypothetical protein
MTSAEELTSLIKNAEERVLSYKQLLEEVSRNKKIFSGEDDLIVWFKNLLREAKNFEQNRLKDLVEEKTYLNSGLNPPYCYLKLKNKNER